MKSQSECKQAIDNEILPDACIDIVIDFTHNLYAFPASVKKPSILPFPEKWIIWEGECSRGPSMRCFLSMRIT